jgi:hypothetical protein
MCGDSSQQDENYQEQADFAKQMTAENATVFGQQQGILASLNAGFSKIIAAGPSQMGYSKDELNNLNTTVDENVGQNMTKASQALGNNQAAMGGGDTFIPSGVKEQENEELAETGAQTDSTLKSQVLQSGYAEGNSNYNNAVAGEEGVATALNPVGYGSTTVSAGGSAANEANAIAASASSPFTAVMGALGGIGGIAAGKLIK